MNPTPIRKFPLSAGRRVTNGVAVKFRRPTHVGGGHLLYACLAATVLLGVSTSALASITPEEASAHIGETATVCGTVVSTKFAEKNRGQPTFLNLDRPYPNHIFTVVIWGDDRAKFGTPEIKFEKQRVCVTGKIQFYRGSPEIILRTPNQVRME